VQGYNVPGRGLVTTGGIAVRRSSGANLKRGNDGRPVCFACPRQILLRKRCKYRRDSEGLQSVRVSISAWH
jgi:hypothetical protein